MICIGLIGFSGSNSSSESNNSSESLTPPADSVATENSADADIKFVTLVGTTLKSVPFNRASRVSATFFEVANPVNETLSRQRYLERIYPIKGECVLEDEQNFAGAAGVLSKYRVSEELEFTVNGVTTYQIGIDRENHINYGHAILPETFPLSEISLSWNPRSTLELEEVSPEIELPFSKLSPIGVPLLSSGPLFTNSDALETITEDWIIRWNSDASDVNSTDAIRIFNSGSSTSLSTIFQIICHAPDTGSFSLPTEIWNKLLSDGLIDSTGITRAFWTGLTRVRNEVGDTLLSIYTEYEGL